MYFQMLIRLWINKSTSFLQHDKLNNIQPLFAEQFKHKKINNVELKERRHTREINTIICVQAILIEPVCNKI